MIKPGSFYYAGGENIALPITNTIHVDMEDRK